MQINRQGKYLTINCRFNPVHIGHHLCMLIDIVPHCFIVSMENMGSINMYHHIRFRVACIIGIPPNMITLIDNMDLMSLLSKLATDNCTRETSAYDQYFFSFHQLSLLLSKNSTAYFVIIFSHHVSSWRAYWCIFIKIRHQYVLDFGLEQDLLLRLAMG